VLLPAEFEAATALTGRGDRLRPQGDGRPAGFGGVPTDA
jgi:hypothetical protein